MDLASTLSGKKAKRSDIYQRKRIVYVRNAAVLALGHTQPTLFQDMEDRYSELREKSQFASSSHSRHAGVKDSGPLLKSTLSLVYKLEP
jgi:hypothetical protein